MLESELPPKSLAKSIADVAKNTQPDNQIVSISGIAPLSENYYIKTI